MVDSGRHSRLKPLGLPDTRGFTPHLRSIMLDKENFLRFRSEKADFSGDGKWFIHDLLHIIFYDFAYRGLGGEAFKNRERFYEVHLASEAFAVLSLDYHILSQQPGETLAVEFTKNQWVKFQKLCPDLPHYLSSHFATFLTQLYLTGETSALKPRKDDREFDIWAGHEVRYSEKQRLYVAQWRADCENRYFEGQIPLIEKSFISEAVQELLALILGPAPQWNNYVKSSVDLSSVHNYFENLPKYKNLKNIDYRFTDFRALDRKVWIEDLEQIREPRPSELFLFWQLASSIDNWDEKYLRLFRDLQTSANSTPDPRSINKDNWRLTQEILIQSVAKIENLPPKRELMSCFFLP